MKHRTPCLAGRLLAVSVSFQLFQWVSAVSAVLVVFCLVGAIVWPLWPFSDDFDDFWVILAPCWPVLVSSASFWPFLSISAGLWPRHSLNRHKIDVYTLTMQLLWDPDHTQASRRSWVWYVSGLVPLVVVFVATIWRPDWRVITIHTPICTSSVTPTPTRYPLPRSITGPSCLRGEGLSLVKKITFIGSVPGPFHTPTEPLLK